MNRKFLILTVASLLMMPMISSASSMSQVQQTKEAENARVPSSLKVLLKKLWRRQRRKTKN